MPPKVSVLMPVFNALPFLDRAVESVLNQTFGDFELIAVDDGSTDASWSRLQHYAKTDRRVLPVQIKHDGIVAALNYGLALTQGEYIARMDADDVSHPERFAEQVTCLNKHPEVAVVGTDLLRIDDLGLPLWTKGVATDHETIERDMLAGHAGAMTHATTMFRQAILQPAGGGYRESARHAEDLELFLRVAEHGRLANLNRVLYEVRMHPQSVTHRESVRRLYTLKNQIVSEAHERRGLTGNLDAMKVVDRDFSSTDHRLMWAWRSLGALNMRTARRHGLGVIRNQPWRIKAWAVVAASGLPRFVLVWLRDRRRDRKMTKLHRVPPAIGGTI